MTALERGRIHALVEALHISRRVLVSGLVVDVDPTAVWVVPVHNRTERAGADDLIISGEVSPFGCKLVVMPSLQRSLPHTAIEPACRALPPKLAAALLDRPRCLPAGLRTGQDRAQPTTPHDSGSAGQPRTPRRQRTVPPSTAVPGPSAPRRDGAATVEPWRTRLATRWHRWRLEAWATRVHADAGRLSEAGLGDDVPARMRSVVSLLVALPDSTAKVWRLPHLDPDRAANAADLVRVAMFRQRSASYEETPQGGDEIHQAVRRLLMRLPPLTAADRVLLEGDAGDLLELIARLVRRSSAASR